MASVTSSMDKSRPMLNSTLSPTFHIQSYNGSEPDQKDATTYLLWIVVYFL
jgi:hypothetical protein